MKPIIILQNAWSAHYAGWGVMPERTYLKALRRSRSGQRLVHLIHHDWSAYDFGNTTPQVGEFPYTQLPPDLDHVKMLIANRPLVIGCGRQAEEVLLALWTGPLIIVPHPACRILTNSLYQSASRAARAPFPSRLRFVQGRGHVIKQIL